MSKPSNKARVSRKRPSAIATAIAKINEAVEQAARLTPRRQEVERLAHHLVSCGSTMLATAMGTQADAMLLFPDDGLRGLITAIEGYIAATGLPKQHVLSMLTAQVQLPPPREAATPDHLLN